MKIESGRFTDDMGTPLVAYRVSFAAKVRASRRADSTGLPFGDDLGVRIEFEGGEIIEIEADGSARTCRYVNGIELLAGTRVFPLDPR